MRDCSRNFCFEPPLRAKAYREVGALVNRISGMVVCTLTSWKLAETIVVSLTDDGGRHFIRYRVA